MSETLTQNDIVRAVTNDPSLSTTEVTLGDTVVKIVDLAYDDYSLFVVKLQPLLGLIVGGLVETVGLSAPESPKGRLDSNSILKYCGSDIPELALLCVKQTLPDMTVERLKLLAKSPFKLATVVVKQIEHNRVIEEVGDFFVQILPFIPRNRKAPQK